MYQVDEIAGGESRGGSGKGLCVVSIVNKGTRGAEDTGEVAGAQQGP